MSVKEGVGVEEGVEDGLGVEEGFGVRDGAAAPAAMAEAAALRSQMLLLLPDLRAFGRFLAGDRAAADDLVQDTVVRALAALGQFQSGTNLKAWLFTILRNLFYEQARRRRREAAAVGAHFTAEEAGPAGQAARSDIHDLQRMLAQLPPLLREALVLVGAQELTHEEAALICGVPVGTMRARVSRARSQLASILASPEAVQV